MFSSSCSWWLSVMPGLRSVSAHRKTATRRRTATPPSFHVSLTWRILLTLGSLWHFTVAMVTIANKLWYYIALWSLYCLDNSLWHIFLVAMATLILTVIFMCHSYDTILPYHLAMYQVLWLNIKYPDDIWDWSTRDLRVFLVKEIPKQTYKGALLVNFIFQAYHTK